MTVSTEQVSKSYKPGAAMAPEAIGFQFLDAADLDVAHVDALTGLAGVLTPGTHYVVAGDGMAGMATITALGTWPAGDDFVITRATPGLQKALIPPHEAVPALALERQLDRQALVGQELDDALKRAITVPRGEHGYELPRAASRAGTILGFGLLGQLVTMTYASLAATLSQLIIPLLPPGRPGAPGTPGINGGVGSSAGSASLWGAFTGMVVAPGITRVRMAGYDAPLGGGFDVIYDAAITPTTAAANPYTQKIAADGRGFRIDPNQLLTWAMFGVKYDYVSDTNRGTDNYAALMAAFTYRPNALYSQAVRTFGGIGKCYSSQTLNPSGTIDICGLGGPGNGAIVGFSPTMIVTPTNVGNLLLKSYEGGAAPGNSTSRVYGITFLQTTFGTGLTAHAIEARTRVHVECCTFTSTAGDGLRIEASTNGATAFGEASGWVSIDNYAHQVRGNGHYALGADTNIGRCVGFSTQSCGLAGVRDDSYFQNIYIQTHLAGYGTGGVHYNGRGYQPTQDSTGITPNTNPQVWHDRGALAAPTSAFPAYNAATAYKAVGPAIGYCTAVMVGTYVEGNGSYGVSYMPNATPLGINQGFNDFTANFGRSLAGASQAQTCTTGVGGARSSSDASSDIYAAIGALEASIVHYRGDGRPLTQRSALFFHTANGSQYALDYENNNGDIVWRRVSAPPAYAITTGAPSAMHFGKPFATLDTFVTYGDALVSKVDSGVTRERTIVSSPPTTGYYRRGHYFENDMSADATVDHWRCKQTGSVATGAWAATFYNIGTVCSNAGQNWVSSSRGTASNGYSGTAPTGGGTFTDPATGFTWEPVGTAPFLNVAIPIPA